jgi:hypothetical protein
MAEVFCDAACFQVRRGRLDLVLPDAHMHLSLAALGHAHLLAAGSGAHPSRESVVLYGRNGHPAVALVLDAAGERERALQHGTFEALRTQFGEHVPFEPAGEEREIRVLH